MRYYFFFYSYRHHRDLHSFPTRRSSDLLALIKKIAPSRINTIAMPEMMTTGRKDASSLRAPGVGSDRKSTRLNSSHRCISYAVFCLKKKKKYQAIIIQKLAECRDAKSPT